MPREVKALKWLVVDLLAAHVDELIELAGEALRALPPDARHALLAVARRKGCLDDAALDALVDETATALDVSGCGDAVTDTGVRALAARGALRASSPPTSPRVEDHRGRIRELVSGAPNLEVLRCGGTPRATPRVATPSRPRVRAAASCLVCWDSRRRSFDSWEALGEDDDVLEIGGPDSDGVRRRRRARASLARLARRRPRQPRPGGAAVSRVRVIAPSPEAADAANEAARTRLAWRSRPRAGSAGAKRARARRGGGREPTKTARARSTRHYEYGRFERQRRARVGRRIRHREFPRPWNRFSSDVSNVREPTTLVVPAARRRLGRPPFSGGPDARAGPSRRPARATGRVRRHTRGKPKTSRRPGALASGLRRASRPSACAGA